MKKPRKCDRRLAPGKRCRRKAVTWTNLWGSDLFRVHLCQQHSDELDRKKR